MIVYLSPYLLRDAMPEAYQLGEHIIASSSKVIAIDKLLADILPSGERVLIFSVRFSQFVLPVFVANVSYHSNGPGAITSDKFASSGSLYFCRMLDMLEDFLAFRSISYARLDGSTNRARRTLDIKLVSGPSKPAHLPPLTCDPSFSKINRVRDPSILSHAALIRFHRSSLQSLLDIRKSWRLRYDNLPSICWAVY
jgi:hypothetical protein